MDEDDDALERACDRIWAEICGLLPHQRRLSDLGDARTVEETRELEWIMRRLLMLRRRAERYREVLRNEAWSRWIEAHARGSG